jgi:hypothetical protein
VDDQGHERSKGFDRKADAQVFLDTEVAPKLATGSYIPPKAGLVTVAEVYASSGSQGHISRKTTATRTSAWNCRVGSQWGHVAVVDVKTAAVRAWVAKMVNDKVGAPTIENAFGLLRQVLGAAVEDARIPRNPCDGVKLPKRQHADRGYLTHSQVAALAGAVERRARWSCFSPTPVCDGVRWPRCACRISTSSGDG